MGHLNFGDFKHIRMEEDEVISHLIFLINKNKKYTHLGPFASALLYPLDLNERPYKGYYILERASRKDLGLPYPDRKPGDIDILIVPYSKDEIHFDRSSVYEVKVVRPTRSNPKKRPNSFGTEQINGYIKDGFPFVSTIHICMTEPLMAHELTPMRHMMRPANLEKPISNEIPPQEAYEILGYDGFSHFTINNHTKRLLSNDIPKYVGLSVLGWNFTEEGQLIESRSLEFSHFEGCAWNPHRKIETINLISDYFNNNKKLFHDVPVIDYHAEDESFKDLKDGLRNIEPDTDENGNSQEGRTKLNLTVQDTYETMGSIEFKMDINLPNLFCFIMKGDAMDDKSDKRIFDGGYVIVQDMGLMPFNEMPLFEPIVLYRKVNQKLILFTGIITKKHDDSKTMRVSFYNTKEEETWIYYNTVKQVFKVIKCLPKEEIVLKETSKIKA